MLQLAKESGAAKVILSEPVLEKRELALKLGADYVVDPTTEDVAEVLDRVSENVNCVIECAGITKTQEDAVSLAGKKATVLFFGLVSPEDKISIKPDQIFKKELTIISSFINPYSYTRAIDVLSMGRLDVTSIISKIIPLDEIEEAFTNAELRRDGKVMIKISKDD